jgi:hypothetical protein
LVHEAEVESTRLRRVPGRHGPDRGPALIIRARGSVRARIGIRLRPSLIGVLRAGRTRQKC